MKKVKIQPLIIVALFISTLANGLAAYRHDGEGQAVAVVFTVLCLLTLTFAVYGIYRNRKINET